MLSRTLLTWCKRPLCLVLLLALLLPAGMTTQAAFPASTAQFDCADVSEIPQSECEALVAFYESTGGNNWMNNDDWLATKTPCSWYGVRCEAGHVSALFLSENILMRNNLRGPIPPEIGDLTALKILDLACNWLTGPIPPEIGALSALESLDLSYNELTALPAEIGNLSALRTLALSNNQLTTLPTEIGDLSALQQLDLGSNRLSGPIPPEIGRLTALTSLDLGAKIMVMDTIGAMGSLNRLSGPIPPEIGQLTALTSLSLSFNQLTGAVPSSIGNLTELTRLDLDGNQLTSLPPEIGNLTALKWLSLGGREWNIYLFPFFFGDDPFTLAGNQLTSLPPEIGNLIALQQLHLRRNRLTSLPSEIGHLTALTRLDLNDNQLRGPIPAEIGDLLALSELRLHGNPLDGALPQRMASLGNLEFFTFYDTNLCIPETGPVADWFINRPHLNDFGTGFICGRRPGAMSGTATLPGERPASGIQVRVFRSIEPYWTPHYVTMTHTDDKGNFHIDGLGQNIDYLVQFIDPTHTYVSTIDTFTPVTVTLETVRTGIDAALRLPQPPAVQVYTESGNVTYAPDGTAQIIIFRANPSDITITRAVTCSVGTPSTVTLNLTWGPDYPMDNLHDDLYQATISVVDLHSYTNLYIVATCGVTTTETFVGHITMRDPSGIVSDKQTGQSVKDATVTLYNVPGWLPKTGPYDDRPNTCQSHASKTVGNPWNQPAPTHLGIIASADVTPATPPLPYQYTSVDGYYVWETYVGCWYVTIQAEGYWTEISPVIGAPPKVTDLNLALTPLENTCPKSLADVSILGPLGVTSTLYIKSLYTFQAIITPTDATPPITYTWSPAPQTGQGTATAIYRWNAPDTYTVTLTAENCGGPVTVTRAFVVEAKDMFTVYLPLVLRDS